MIISRCETCLSATYDAARLGLNMDTGYLPFYFQGYRILSILLPGICDTVFNIWVTFRDIEYFGKLIMGIFTSL